MKTLLISLGIIAQTVVGVDPATVVGAIKPMNGVNNAPVKEYQESFNALRIPWDEPDRYSARMRPTVKAAAFVAAAMCECQRVPVDMLMYYDLRTYTSYCGPFSIGTYDKMPPYWALYYWADLAEYGTQVASTCNTENIYTCAARSKDGSHVRLLISRYHQDDAYKTSRDVTVSLPEGWSVTSARITDSEGQDRHQDPASTYTMESNSLILLEISKEP